MENTTFYLISGLFIGAFIGVMIMYIKNVIAEHKTPSDAYVEQQLNAAINQAYMQGYELGKAAGERDAIFKKYTTNDLRAALNLPPIEDGAEWVTK